MPIVEQRGTLPDLDRSAQEQVQIIGSIQPHGVLFALSEADLVVRQVSANISLLLGISPDLVLGRSFEAVLGAEQFARFRSQVLGGEPLAATQLRVPVSGSALEMQMYCAPHRHDGVLLAELEPSQGAHSLEPLDIDAHIRIPLSRLEAAFDIPELARVTAIEIGKLTGFGRVMIYCFDEEWNGEVIAEVAVDSPVSYFGLRFPASDIPAQARQLFLINPLRTIVDVNAAGEAIVPGIGPPTGRALDLTRSVLRSVSPIHLEYLRNMGVQSSMTISIIIAQRLWGLIACHHPQPRRMAPSIRAVCELIAQTFASQIASRIDNAVLLSRLNSRERLDRILAGIEAAGSFLDAALSEGPRMMDLFDADGLVSRTDRVISSHGDVLETEAMLPVIDKLREIASQGIANSNALGKLESGIGPYSNQASGALYLSLAETPTCSSPSIRGSCSSACGSFTSCFR